MTATYEEYLATKRRHRAFDGIPTDALSMTGLFLFQRDIVIWALRKGRAAIFADCGLGKTPMQLAWAERVFEFTHHRPVLIVAPLAVAQQTVSEGEKFGRLVRYVRSSAEVSGGGIYITNYERVKDFDARLFAGIVLDESSILKAVDGATRDYLVKWAKDIPYRLCCTATPAPNDVAELANHAEFLGVATRAEMLAAYFVHDQDGWRLKGHAREPFYQWVASWAMALRKPSDLGYSDKGYKLPRMTVNRHLVASDYTPPGQLFAVGLKGVSDRAKVRNGTIEARVQAAATHIQGDKRRQWIAWCGLNEESERLTEILGPDAVEVTGSMREDEKADALMRFAAGKVRVLVTKIKIAGFGMNFQNACRQVFVGLNDSYEQFYQATRRSYRFGQKRQVEIHVIVSDVEEAIYQNVMRKEREAVEAMKELVASAAKYEREELEGVTHSQEYATDIETGNGWTMYLGDCVEWAGKLPDRSVDVSVFSPPFASLYTYSPSDRDMGNTSSIEEFTEHFRFLVRELRRVMKPGRNVAVHCAQLGATLNTDGYIGIKDFRGSIINLFEGEGFILHGEVTIDKDPQAQAIRTHAKGLLFVQKNKDSTASRPALADYMLIFQNPGKNEVPVVPDVSNDEWIAWARPIWYGIRESDTLNVAVARENEDERHICPLQLGAIERVVRLYSNPGETVFSPFAGIGSEGYEAVRLGRRFIGTELKPSYFRTAVSNLRTAESLRAQRSLFDEVLA